jgi:preprotein translocase subunit YajC
MYNIINSAFAQEVAQTAAKQPSTFTSLAPLVLIMVVFYFLLIRPQQKKIKEHQNMLTAIAKGDEVVTSGGIIGNIVKIEEENNIAYIEIADKVKIKIRKDTILEVLSPKKEVTEQKS